ncbi:MAG TPA: hypothetical protein ENH57_02555 [Actinobacteria bacterium]|nr:hypothetical protein [Actinomycetota bacterium]
MNQTKNNRINVKEIIGLAVVAVSEGQKLGVIKNVLVDSKQTHSPFFLVEDEQWYKGGKIIKACDVTKIGSDSLTIKDKNAIKLFNETPDLEAMINKGDSFRDKRVITIDKLPLGRVKEYSIDRNKISVVDLEVINIATEKKTYCPIENVKEVKKDLIVVTQSSSKFNSKDIEKVKDNGEEEDNQVKEKKQEKSASAAKVKSKADKEVNDSKETEQLNESVSEKVSTKTAPTTSYKDLKQILEERQSKFMLGKKVDRDIADNEGNMIIKKGQEITKDTLEKAKKSHKFIVLSFCIKTDLAKGPK